MIVYNIHDLVKVIVETSVGPAVIAGIDFQLGGFRHEMNKNIDSMPSKIPTLVIRRYTKGIRSIGGDEKTKPVFDDPKSCLGLLRDEKGLVAYVRTGNFLINLLVQILLVEQRVTQVHAAGVENGSGDVTLFPAEGGVGKTAIAGYLVKECGHRLLGDDILMIGANGESLGIPRAFVLKGYHREVFPEAYRRLGMAGWWRWNFDLGRVIRENMPLRGLARWAIGRTRAYLLVAQAFSTLSNGAVVPIETIFGKEKIVSGGKVRRVVLLERCSRRFAVKKADVGEVGRKMFAVIHKEWQSFMSSFFGFGAADVIDIPQYVFHVQDIINCCLAKADVLKLELPQDATGAKLGQFYAKEMLGL
jgi:hypothetical protein